MIKYNGKVITYNDKWIKEPGTGPVPDPYNPLNLPPNTVRIRTNDGNAPSKSSAQYETATLVPGTTDNYDVYKSGISFNDLLKQSTNVIEVLGANTTGITSMRNMFYNCTELTTVALFDTSNVTNMSQVFTQCSSLTSIPLFNTSNATNMYGIFDDCTSLTSVPLLDTSNVKTMSYAFADCWSLTSIPLFNTSKVTDINAAFLRCYNVQSGALALYQQASTQTNPPTNHQYAFRECGKDTQTGAEELAQIPSAWK